MSSESAGPALREQPAGESDESNQNHQAERQHPAEILIDVLDSSESVSESCATVIHNTSCLLDSTYDEVS